MPASCVMLIRHGEKPSTDGDVAGVTLEGAPSPDELSVRGWQRSGALARFFAPLAGAAIAAGITTPTHLFAPKPTVHVPSRRSSHTLAPLAELLGLTVRTDFEKGQEADLAAAIANLSGAVLVAWEHKALRAIGAALASDVGLPQTWPDERFDMVWSFERLDAGWSFRQVPQLLLAGDSADSMQ